MLLFGLHPVMVRVTIHANVAITAGQHCSFAAPLDPNCHRWDHRPQPLEKAGVEFTNGKRPGVRLASPDRSRRIYPKIERIAGR